uniref:Uncharacterized protein n=1 Tax=Oryza brachyantha TaxID=4533 RepID=J3LQK1_ORYBR
MYSVLSTYIGSTHCVLCLNITVCGFEFYGLLYSDKNLWTFLCLHIILGLFPKNISLVTEFQCLIGVKAFN